MTDWPAERERLVRDAQAWLGVEPDGKPWDKTWAAWEAKTGRKRPAPGPESKSGQIRPDLATAVARAAFPRVPLARLQKHVPLVTQALRAFGIYSGPMLLMALATIRAETAGFEPISERKSRFNTEAGGEPFALYGPGTRIGKNLGNTEPGDGARFKGRGFIQLTGRDNYRRIGEVVGVDLLGSPELANEPRVAARILAAFLEAQQARIYAALRAGDLAKARKIVNGGRHGLDEFKWAYRAGAVALGPETKA